MAKSNKFTVQVNSAKGLTVAQQKRLESSINKAVKGGLAALDFKGNSIAFKGIRTRGIIANIKVLK